MGKKLEWLAAAAQALPPVQALRKWRYARQFRNWPGAFRGIYGTFAEALSSVDPGAKVGYDHPELARMYLEWHEKLETNDYPMLFWLRDALKSGARVFELGGHLGVAYYAYRRYLEYPADLSWRILEVPRIAAAGRVLASERGATSLSFAANFEEVEGSDIFLAAGSLQYIEEPIARRLAAIRHKPQHLFFNRLPLTEGEAFVTLQNTMHSFNAYAAFNRQEFIGSLEDLGYALVDSWVDPGRSCKVPFHPRHSISAYSGLYLRAKPSARSGALG